MRQRATRLFSIGAGGRRLPPPALDISFTASPTLDSRITYTRAGTGATRINSSGLLENVAASTPRFTYDRTSLALLGVLNEESRTNSVPNSEAFGSWTLAGTTVSANAAAGPRGSATADRVFETATLGQHGVFFTPSVVSGTTYAFSVYLTPTVSNTRYVYCRTGVAGGNRNVGFDLQTQTVTYASAGLTGFVEPGPNGTIRLGFIATAPSTLSSYVQIALARVAVLSDTFVDYTGVVTNYIDVDCAQWEVGASVTTYIGPVTSTAVTRNADAFVMSGTNLSWYTDNEGTFLADFIPASAPAAATRGILSVDSAAQRGHYFALGSTISARSRDATAVYATSGQSYTANSITRVVGVLSQNLRNVSVNGSAVLANTSAATVPTNTQFLMGDQRIEGTGAQQCNAIFRRIAYWSTNLSNDQIILASTS